MKSAHDIIDELDLQPHPEGGYYKETYRSEQSVFSDASKANRSAVTCIYFLLTKGDISRFHKVAHDEVWNFYVGAPLRLLDISGTQLNDITLGDYQQSLTSHHVIQAGHWQAAETTGEYSLVGCTVAPGFDFADFTFLSDDKAHEAIHNQHPNLRHFI